MSSKEAGKLWYWSIKYCVGCNDCLAICPSASGLVGGESFVFWVNVGIEVEVSLACV